MSSVNRKGGLAMSLTSHIVRTLFTIGDLKRDLGWSSADGCGGY